MGWFEYIKNDWGVLRAAPLAFVALSVVGFGGGWFTANTMRDQELANLETLLRLKEFVLE